jgi:hypothetical protein
MTYWTNEARYSLENILTAVNVVSVNAARDVVLFFLSLSRRRARPIEAAEKMRLARHSSVCHVSSAHQATFDSTTKVISNAINNNNNNNNENNHSCHPICSPVCLSTDGIHIEFQIKQ